VQISPSGRQFIKISEGVRYKAYKDDRGYYTTATGHLIEPNESYLIDKILLNADVDAIFNKDAAPRENWLNQNCDWDNPIKQYEFDMLMDWMWQYDVATYPHTRQAIIEGDRQNIINHIMEFCDEVGGSGDDNLRPRREREKKLFLTGKYA